MIVVVNRPIHLARIAACVAAIGGAFVLPAQATSDSRLAEFYKLLFAQGCKKHPDFIPGRNKHWLAQAGFQEEEFTSLIDMLKKRGALTFDDGFIVGQIGECAS